MDSDGRTPNRMHAAKAATQRDYIDKTTQREAFVALRDFAETICWPVTDVLIAVLVDRNSSARQKFADYLDTRDQLAHIRVSPHDIETLARIANSEGRGNVEETLTWVIDQTASFLGITTS